MRHGATIQFHALAMAGREKWLRSAYSASAPVIARVTLASIATASRGCSPRKLNPMYGLSARRIDGDLMICGRPRHAMVMNQMNIMGAKAIEIRRVPKRCAATKMARMTAAIHGLAQAED